MRKTVLYEFSFINNGIRGIDHRKVIESKGVIVCMVLTAGRVQKGVVQDISIGKSPSPTLSPAGREGEGFSFAVLIGPAIF